MNNKDKSKQMLIIGLIILGLNIFAVSGTYISNGYSAIKAIATSIGANIFVIIGGLLCYFAYKNKGSPQEGKEPLNKKSDNENVVKHEISEEEKKLAQKDKIILLIFGISIISFLIILHLFDI